MKHDHKELIARLESAFKDSPNGTWMQKLFLDAKNALAGTHDPLPPYPAPAK